MEEEINQSVLDDEHARPRGELERGCATPCASDIKTLSVSVRTNLLLPRSIVIVS
jgi:hypothetical protein